MSIAGTVNVVNSDDDSNSNCKLYVSSNAVSSNNNNTQHVLHSKFQAKWFTNIVTFKLTDLL